MEVWRGSVISSETKENPGHVTLQACNLKHAKIDMALFGEDGRGGVVKDIGDIKSDQRIIKKSLKSMEENRTSDKEEDKKKKRDWRGFLYSVIGGVIVAGASWIISNLH